MLLCRENRGGHARVPGDMNNPIHGLSNGIMR